MMTKIESDQWACRPRTWFRFRLKPSGKVRGFPWWAKHRWRGVKATGEGAALTGGSIRYLTMTCTRCGVPEEIHITNLAEFLMVADVKLPDHVAVSLGLTPPNWKPWYQRLARAAGRFVGRRAGTLARILRFSVILALSPLLVPQRLYKDWHYRRTVYLEGLAALRVNREQGEQLEQIRDNIAAGLSDLATQFQRDQPACRAHPTAPIITVPAPDPTLKEKLEELDRKNEELKERLEEVEEREPASAYEVPKCQAQWCEKPEFCGICHRCADCSSSVPLDTFTGLHDHSIETKGPDQTFGGRTF